MKTNMGTAIMVVALVSTGAQADSITHGGTTINMDFVDIGYAGNAADTTGHGSVGYNYRIGKYEVTADQWSQVIAADSGVGDAGLWSGSQPTAETSWYEAAKFCNWLTSGNYNKGAYRFHRAGWLIEVNRTEAVAAHGTVYVLPTEDEWYKAAYFRSDGSGYTPFATGNVAPSAGVGGENYGSVVGAPWDVGTGAFENNGTYDMNGNVFEMQESAFDGTLDDMDESRVIRGGAFYHDASRLHAAHREAYGPTDESSNIGFRVAAIPEPSSIALIGLVGGITVFARRLMM
jgi:formylglycine-generating enzyme required for sulfatase activity